MRFAKYHGTGNDFILIEDLEDEIVLTPEFVAAACHRGLGVGADGVIRIAPTPEADFFMDYYNADGGVAEMCGNGIRCLAKYVFDRGLTGKRDLAVLTRAGVKQVSIDAEDGVVRQVTVDMGRPALDVKDVPMTGNSGDRFVAQPLEAGGRTYPATALSMGNPHVVLFLDQSDDLQAFDVRGVGSLVEHRREFPNGTNVEFVNVGDGLIDARVWERGSGETMACGTGACAALVASAVSGKSGRVGNVRFPGGLLHVEWRDDDRVLLTGPAVQVYEAEFDPRWLGELMAGSVRERSR